MDLIQLTTEAYQLRGGSNAGLIVRDGQAVVIDTGLDKDTARKVWRHVETLKVRVAGIVITHAHADHFGGAAALRARSGAPVYAPALESAVIENPILEPLYLFSGAMPPAELRHKFTLAEPCKVDYELRPGQLTIEGLALQVMEAPGHAPNQMIVAGGGVCYVADAVFAPEVLEKHAVPFFVDVDQWQATLTTLPALDGHFEAFVPGHGPAVTLIEPWAAKNSARLASVRAAVAEALDANANGELADIVSSVAGRLGLEIAGPALYWLTQTPVLACLTSLQRAGQAVVEIVGNRLVWRLIPPAA